MTIKNVIFYEDIEVIVNTKLTDVTNELAVIYCFQRIFKAY